jgi:hypothetical protein
MDRRSLLGAFVAGVVTFGSGCLSRYETRITGNPATTVREADRAGNLTGYDELGCEVSQEESLATPVSAMTFGEGTGEHWVYLLADTPSATPVDIEVIVGSEPIYAESVELGGDRYTSYEFTYQAPYSLSVTLGGTETRLEVADDRISSGPGSDAGVSGQTYCLTVDGGFEEQRWRT